MDRGLVLGLSLLIVAVMTLYPLSIEVVAYSTEPGLYDLNPVFLRLAKFENNKMRALVEVPENTDLSVAEKILRGWGIDVVDRIGLVNSLVVYVSMTDIPRVRYLLRGSHVYPDIELELLERPVDVLYRPLYEVSQSPGYNMSYAPNASRYLVQAPSMWDMGYTGRGVRVAVLDTGIESRHPWLLRPDNTSVVVYHYDVTNDTVEYCDIHGTHVAGIIAAQFTALQKTGIGSNYTYPGVAPDAMIYDIKVFNSTYHSCSRTLSSWIIKGLERALLGPDGVPNTGDEADIISMSLGGLVEPYILPYIKTHPLIKALSKAVAMNKIVVVAAGNSGPGGYTLNFMCVAEGVLCVSAAADQWSTDTGALFTAFFSSRGPLPWGEPPLMISAPGVFIISSIPTTYRPPYVAAAMSGTSMATPHVSGVAALLRQALPTATTREIVTRLLNSALLYKNEGVYTDVYPWNRFLVSPNMSLLALGDPYREPCPMVEGFGLVRAYDALTNPIQLVYDDYRVVRTYTASTGGSYVVGRLYLVNRGSVRVSVSLYPVGFTDYGGLHSIKGYISVTPYQVSVQPGSTATLDLSIEIPRSTLPGTYSGYIVALGRTEDGREYVSKVVLSVNIPLLLDRPYPTAYIETYAGLTAEPLYYMGSISPEWIAYLVNVSRVPETPLMLRLSSRDSLVNMHIDDLVLILPDNSFDNLQTGNALFRTTGVYIVVIGWLSGAYDIGTLQLSLYTTAPVLENIVSSVMYNVSGILSEIDLLKSRISVVEKNLSSVLSGLEVLQNIVNSHNTSIEDLSQRYSRLVSEIDSVARSIRDVISSLNTSIYREITVLREDLVSNTTTLWSYLDRVSRDLSSTRENIDLVNRSITEIRRDLYSRTEYIESILGVLLILSIVSVVLAAAALVVSILSSIRRSVHRR